MPDLDFQIVNVEPARDLATPALAFHLRLTNRAEQQPVHAILLRCQIQIEAPRRRYKPQEQEQLRDLFGEPERWAQTLRTMLWANTTVNVPSFTGSIVYPISVPCTFDLTVANAKYFHALEDGDVPLTFLFSGTVFYDSGQTGFQAAPVPWNKEARFRLPVRVWKEMMDLHYPNTTWLCLRRDAFNELYRFKIKEGIATFDETVERLLALAEQPLEVS
jgi:hypothetical protein